MKQRKKVVALEDEILFEALQAGIEKNRLEAEASRGPRMVFHLRTVSPWRRCWRNVKAFFRKLFRMEDDLG